MNIIMGGAMSMWAEPWLYGLGYYSMWAGGYDLGDRPTVHRKRFVT